MNEYPKMMYKGTDVLACLEHENLVTDAEQEKAARKDGYEMYVEIHARANAQRKAKAK